MRPIADQTILISGATDGLGKSLAAELAAGGATLLLHGRDDGKGQDTVRELQRRSGNRRVRWYRADLSSLREAGGKRRPRWARPTTRTSAVGCASWRTG